jgi:hypothetical protein
MGEGAAEHVAPLVVEIEGQLWYVCPYEGPCCVRVSAALGAEWAIAVLERHVDLHHVPWR